MTSPIARSIHIFCLLAVLMAAALLPAAAMASSYTYHVDAHHLGQIGKASLIYASDHQDKLPTAGNVWEYAEILAESSADLNDSRVWQSRIDPASASTYHDDLTILLPAQAYHPKRRNPEFLTIKPAVAVALGELHMSMPATTPVAWTRGLQPDGTWAAHSPYGTYGGHIVFIGGNVQFFRNLGGGGGQLTRFDGQGMTANILEALPPGTRIGEYTPTAEEQIAWANIERQLSIPSSPLRLWIPLLLLIWIPHIVVSAYRFKNHRPGAFTVLIWPVIYSLLLMIILSTVGSVH